MLEKGGVLELDIYQGRSSAYPEVRALLCVPGGKGTPLRTRR